MIISRYIVREITITLIVVTTILLLTLLCQQTVRYLNYVAVGKIPLTILLQLLSFEIPYLLALLLPLGLYLSIILALGRLHQDNEMTIMKIAGYGTLKLLKLILLLSLGAAVIVLILMTWVNPFISATRQKMIEQAASTAHLVELLLPGRFHATPDGKNVLYVEKISRDRMQAENVFLAQEVKKNHGKQTVWNLVRADKGYQMYDPHYQRQFFVTQNGYRYEGTPGQKDFTMVHFKKYAIGLPLEETTVRRPREETLSTTTLWNHYYLTKQAAELQWRFSIALSTLLLALLALPVSAVRPRVGRYLLLVPAILVYVIYINLLFIARHWLEDGLLPIFLGMWWVHALIFLFILLVFWVCQSKLR